MNESWELRLGYFNKNKIKARIMIPSIAIRKNHLFMLVGDDLRVHFRRISPMIFPLL